MGSKLSSASDSETLAESAATAMSGSVGGLNRHHRHHHYHRHHMSASTGARSRARSFGGVTHREAGATSSGALDIDLSSLLDLDRPRSRSVIGTGSVPVRVFSFGKIVFFHLSLVLHSAALLISLVLASGGSTLEQRVQLHPQFLALHPHTSTGIRIDRCQCYWMDIGWLAWYRISF